VFFVVGGDKYGDSGFEGAVRKVCVGFLFADGVEYGYGKQVVPD
jgi:hypothetical protein